MTATLEVFPSVTCIADEFKGILLDAYGVFWGGNAYGLLPGSKEVMEKLVSNGKIVGILSNSTQLAAKEVSKLASHGLVQGKHFHFLITSGELAREIFLNEKLPFKTPKKQFWLFGGVHPKFSSHETIFNQTPYRETSQIDEADFIYLSIPHIQGEDQLDPNLFRHDLEKIREKNLPMVCANPDLFAHEGTPPKAVVRQGSIAKMYEEMGGQVFYIGKPHQKAFLIALDRFREHMVVDVTNPRQILMVGDTPETDIRGARRMGMTSALVIKTGVMADRIDHQGQQLAWAALSPDDLPTYIIERL